MFKIIVLSIFAIITFVFLVKSQRPLLMKGGANCLISAYLSLWIAFFMYGINWIIMLVLGIACVIGVFIWFSIQDDNKSNQDFSDTSTGLVNQGISWISNTIFGENNVSSSLSGWASNKVNDKLGLYNVDESDTAPIGRKFNVIYFLAVVVIIMIAIFKGE